MLSLRHSSNRCVDRLASDPVEADFGGPTPGIEHSYGPVRSGYPEIRASEPKPSWGKGADRTDCGELEKLAQPDVGALGKMTDAG